MPKNRETQLKNQHDHYMRNKEKYRDATRRRRKNLRAWYDQIKDVLCCKSCGEIANECLDLHHIDPAIKNEQVINLVNALRTRDTIIEELQKCICLCANCHRKHHCGNLNLVFTTKDCIVFDDLQL